MARSPVTWSPPLSLPNPRPISNASAATSLHRRAAASAAKPPSTPCATAVSPRPNPAFRLTAEILTQLPETLRQSQDVFERTGGLHGAALFDAHGKLEVAREDIGRHNAVDKVIGWALLEKPQRVPLSQSVLLVSGRGGFEIIQKAIAAGIPVVASVSAPSSLAVQLAREMRQTLVGFLRGTRFVIYSGEERIVEGTT